MGTLMREWIGFALAALVGLLLGYFRRLGDQADKPVVAPELNFRYRPRQDPATAAAQDMAEFQREWEQGQQLRAALWAQADIDLTAARRLWLLLRDDLERDVATRPLFAADVAAGRADPNVLVELDAGIAEARQKLTHLDERLRAALPPSDGAPAA
jgi:hypothetical protein